MRTCPKHDVPLIVINGLWQCPLCYRKKYDVKQEWLDAFYGKDKQENR